MKGFWYVTVLLLCPSVSKTVPGTSWVLNIYRIDWVSQPKSPLASHLDYKHYSVHKQSTSPEYGLGSVVT